MAFSLAPAATDSPLDTAAMLTGIFLIGLIIYFLTAGF